jgi:Acetyltransferase (GNAT) domain
MTSATIELGRTDDAARPWLRLAGADDQELLRSWRNSHTSRFYNQEAVTPEGQRRWFEAYLERPDDYLFMVMEGDHPVGCIGLRFLDGAWDLYNVIRGVSTKGSQGFMSLSLGLVLGFARRTRQVPVRVEVLPDNPALGWYISNGFAVVDCDTRCVRLIHPRPMPREHEERA